MVAYYYTCGQHIGHWLVSSSACVRVDYNG